MLMTKYSTTDSLVDLLHAQGNTRKFQNHTNSQAEIIPKSQAEINRKFQNHTNRQRSQFQNHTK